MLTKKTIIVLMGIIFVFAAFAFVNTDDALAADITLTWGDQGSNVKVMQQTLNDNGYWCGTVDGIFGSKTYQAVKRFERDCGLYSDGTADPKTLKYLGLEDITSISSKSSSQASQAVKEMTMVATGYCPCLKCNYPYGGQPSYLGYPLGYGIIATDPDVIPMGTRLYVPGYGEGIAADQGGAINGNRLDLCFNSHQQALNWGIKTVTITILN